MLIPEAAQYIRESVSARTVAALYGYKPNEKGFMVCPFHVGDRHPSLKLYDSEQKKGWYCFGCHSGGSCIDFVMRHESCDFVTAVRAIDRHLHLNLLTVEDFQTQEAYTRAQRKFDAEAEKRMRAIDNRKSSLESEIDREFALWLAIEHTPALLRTAQDWDESLQLREDLDYKEYLLTVIERERKEVREWRNSQRLAPNPP